MMVGQHTLFEKQRRKCYLEGGCPVSSAAGEKRQCIWVVEIVRIWVGGGGGDDVGRKVIMIMVKVAPPTARV